MNTFVWQGRIDHEETGISTRWHQHVRPFGKASTGGVALIGFAVDEGVRRNGGRTGATDGPRALRAALASLPVLGEPAVWDAGDVTCESAALESAQDALAGRVASAIGQGCLPLVLGGGHEVAWGSFQGLVRARPELRRILIVNFDAHFDLRVAAHANSGTPFRQIADWCAAHGQPFDYQVFGISRYANTQALFERADALGVRYALDEALQSENDLARAREALLRELDACEAVYLTVCLDVLPGGQAPGVSAPAALGVPLANVQSLIDTVLVSGKLATADIAELNPGLDRDGLTARVAARIAAQIARGVSAG
jgi:formiminoglutamase